MDTEWPVERLRRMAKAYDSKLPNRNPRDIDVILSEVCSSTADTIERLTKQRDEFDRMGRNAVERSLALAKQRDDARAEVETAAAIENTMGMEITRLQGEVERLKAELEAEARSLGYTG